MVDEPDSLVLRYLRRIDEKVDRLSDDMREVKQRLGTIEEGLALQGHSIASVSKRLDLVNV